MVIENGYVILSRAVAEEEYDDLREIVTKNIPNRVERIKCLGNAVVPQVAQVFARAIKEVIESENRNLR